LNLPTFFGSSYCPFWIFLPLFESSYSFSYFRSRFLWFSYSKKISHLVSKSFHTVLNSFSIFLRKGGKSRRSNFWNEKFFRMSSSTFENFPNFLDLSIIFWIFLPFFGFSYSFLNLPTRFKFGSSFLSILLRKGGNSRKSNFRTSYFVFGSSFLPSYFFVFGSSFLSSILLKKSGNSQKSNFWNVIFCVWIIVVRLDHPFVFGSWFLSSILLRKVGKSRKSNFWNVLFCIWIIVICLDHRFCLQFFWEKVENHENQMFGTRSSSEWVFTHVRTFRMTIQTFFKFVIWT